MFQVLVGIWITICVPEIASSINWDQNMAAREKNEEIDTSYGTETPKYDGNLMKRTNREPLELIQEAQALSDSISNYTAQISDPGLIKLCKRLTKITLILFKKYPSFYETHQSPKNVSLTCWKITGSSDTINYVPQKLHLTNDYANYDDVSEEYLKKIDSLEMETFNIINDSVSAAKVIAVTTMTGDPFIRIKTNISETLLWKESGANMINQTLKSQTISVVPSDDFINDDHSYDILLTTWKNDIFWWNPSKVIIDTYVLSYQFWHSTCAERIFKFKKPSSIYLEWNQDHKFVENIYHYVFTIPEGYKEMVNELNLEIEAYPFLLPPKSLLFYKFHNMTETENFMAVMTKDHFPSVDDLRTERLPLTPEMSYTKLYNLGDQERVFYIGILARRRTKIKYVDYQISTLLYHCLTWERKERKWKPGCNPGPDTNTTTLHCECQEFAIVAGDRENFIHLKQKVIDIGIELVLLSNGVVFAGVICALILYCTLMLLVLKCKTQETIYYLADNNLNHRFAYVIVVRTGLGITSGTSSNVVIRLVGKKKSSLAHVLTYPDPKMYILQKSSNDMFMLLTKNHLGDLKYIELWFDSIGQSPRWYCQSISVYDLQTHITWHFVVQKSLNVIQNKSYISVPPSEKIDQAQIANKKQSRNKFQYGKYYFKCKGFEFEPRYHSWCFCNYEKTFSYIKKISVIYSKLMTTGTVILIIYGIPTFTLMDCLDTYREFKFGASEVLVALIGSFTSFIIHFPISWYFRLSGVQFSRYEQEVRFSFRHTKVCWFILITLMLFSTTFLIIYGFWVPWFTSTVWAATTTLGYCFSVFGFEFIMILVQSFALHIELPNSIQKKVQDIIEVTAMSRTYLHRKFGKDILRPYFQHLYKPLAKIQLKKKIIKRTQRHTLLKEMEDLVMFGIYIIILYVMILVTRDESMAVGQTTLSELFNGEFTKTMSPYEVDIIPKIYDYINLTLIPSLQPTEWYENFPVDESGFVYDKTDKCIAVVRIRQTRINPKFINTECQVPEIMRFLNLTCKPEICIKNTERGKFSSQWKPYTSNMEYDRLKFIWDKSDGSKKTLLDTSGEFAVYSSSTYNAFLGMTLNNSLANLNKYYKESWIDHYTRGVLLEWLMYNANNNMFNGMSVSFEKSVSGLMVVQIKVEPVRMLFVKSRLEFVGFVFSILFLIWVCLLCLKKAVGIIQNWRTIYKDVWLMIDIIIILFSFATIGLYSSRLKLIEEYVDTLETARKNEFINYFALFKMEMALITVAGFLICISTIRLWRFFRFALIFRILERTLKISIGAAISFTVYFMLISMAHGFGIYFVLGTTEWSYYTVLKVSITLVTMPYHPEDMKFGNYTDLAAILYICCFIIFHHMATSIFTTIIVFNYSKSQSEASIAVRDYNMKDLVFEKGRYFGIYCKYKYGRSRGGFESTHKVEPKEDRALYWDSVSIESSRLRLATYCTMCIIKKKILRNKTQTRNDFGLMLHICSEFFTHQKNEKDVFFKGHIEGQKVKLIDEQVLDKIANVTNLLLQGANVATPSEIKRTNLYKINAAIKQYQNKLRKCTLRLKLMANKMKHAETMLRK